MGRQSLTTFQREFWILSGVMDKLVITALHRIHFFYPFLNNISYLILKTSRPLFVPFLVYSPGNDIPDHPFMCVRIHYKLVTIVSNERSIFHVNSLIRFPGGGETIIQHTSGGIILLV